MTKSETPPTRDDAITECQRQLARLVDPAFRPREPALRIGGAPWTADAVGNAVHDAKLLGHRLLDVNPRTAPDVARRLVAQFDARIDEALAYIDGDGDPGPLPEVTLSWGEEPAQLEAREILKVAGDALDRADSPKARTAVLDAFSWAARVLRGPGSRGLRSHGLAKRVPLPTLADIFERLRVCLDTFPDIRPDELLSDCDISARTASSKARRLIAHQLGCSYQEVNALLREPPAT